MYLIQIRVITDFQDNNPLIACNTSQHWKKHQVRASKNTRKLHVQNGMRIRRHVRKRCGKIPSGGKDDREKHQAHGIGEKCLGYKKLKS